MTPSPTITPQEFFARNNGKGLDFDHAFGNECVDVLQQYNKDVIGGSFIPGPTAKAIWEGSTPEEYIKIPNSTDPENKPQTGDVLFIDPNHVCIVVTADEIDTILSFDQNYPQQGYWDSHGNFIGTGVCHLQFHGYGHPINVLGWWRPKKFA